MGKKSDPDLPLEPPLWLGPRSNGEFFIDGDDRVRQFVLRRADELAPHYGKSRRDFLQSSMGMALTLAGINLIHGCEGGKYSADAMARDPKYDAGSVDAATGADGGHAPDVETTTPIDTSFEVPIAEEAPFEPLECERLFDVSGMFIFDVQTHHVLRDHEGSFLARVPQAMCGEPDLIDCYSLNRYIEKIFLDSDTDLAMLTGLPTVVGDNPLTNDELAQSVVFANQAGKTRLFRQAVVLPNYEIDRQFDEMQAATESGPPVSSWKVYKQWSPPGGQGFLMDHDIALRTIEHARRLDVKMFCAHIGVPALDFDDENYGGAADYVRAARMYPDVAFIMYHSNFRHRGADETVPFSRTGPEAGRGINSLCNALIDQGVGAGSNVYAEIGATWYSIMSNPLEAAHVMGKLMKYLGEDNILWGSDCIWFGSPQPLIEAFLAFEITEEFQDRYGYPPLTMRAKRKILGLNAARIFEIDPYELKCTARRSRLGYLKRRLDAEFGRYRHAIERPVIDSFDKFRRFWGLT